MSDAEPTRDLFKRFSAYIAQNKLLPDHGIVVVGVSGGADSTCLLDLLCRSRSTADLCAVHVNYGLRGVDSDTDEHFVRELCRDRGLSLTVHRADASWRTQALRQSMQEAARNLRYEVMLETARAVGSETVAVAHHLDDQAETILLRLMRGTGAPGLAAMRPRRPMQRGGEVMLIRPLLFAARREIEEHCALRNLAYRDDASNCDDRFDRARVRSKIFPAIVASFGETAIRNIADAAARLQELLDTSINPIIEGDLAALIDLRREGVHLNLESLRALPSARRRLVLMRALQEYLPEVPKRSSVIERTEALIDRLPGKRLRFEGGSIWRDRESLVLVARTSSPRLETALIEIGVRNETPYGAITLERIDPAVAARTHDTDVEVVDASLLSQPLSLGPWRPGERFQPLGFSGTKKISDFLTDMKVPTYSRRSVPVLRSGSDVVWIPGLRLAHPFRLTGASKSAVRMRFESEA